MAQEPFIVCENLVKIFKIADLETVALQGLDLVVAPGELLGIVGPSGSGKTTLMNILGGLDRPSAGRVWVAGQDLLKLSNSALNLYRRSMVGFVWQQGSRNLIPFLSALDNVELPMTLAGASERIKRRRARALLEAVGLDERQDHRMQQLSGGEQQRVAIAVALANNPKLLLADEPTGEVDSATALTIYETIQRLNREFKVTTLIVSHDPGIARHVDRVVAIRDGKTATETVRQSTLSRMADPDAIFRPTIEVEEEEEEVFEELAVLDSAGRLQVPKEYLEYFEIKGRARLEVTEEGVLIRPAPEAERLHTTETLATDLPDGDEEAGGGRRLFSLVERAKGRALNYAAGFRHRTPDRQRGSGSDSEPGENGG
jgi:ABC-type lipoprotein export system ATPase subunit/bifunctional DNA-binding transcriptional regulator/antitoxin component of YhaV-PrlF toxin-antitoxin module